MCPELAPPTAWQHCDIWCLCVTVLNCRWLNRVCTKVGLLPDRSQHVKRPDPVLSGTELPAAGLSVRPVREEQGNSLSGSPNTRETRTCPLHTLLCWCAFSLLYFCNHLLIILQNIYCAIDFFFYISLYYSNKSELLFWQISQWVKPGT